MVRLRSPAPYGSVPERPKGADCKSVVTDFGGPNPPAPTKQKRHPDGCLFCLVEHTTWLLKSVSASNFFDSVADKLTEFSRHGIL